MIPNTANGAADNLRNLEMNRRLMDRFRQANPLVVRRGAPKGQWIKNKTIKIRKVIKKGNFRLLCSDSPSQKSDFNH